MGVKVCITDGCWQPTSGTRCPEHEAAWQRERNARRGPERRPDAPYRKVSLIGHACWCCGSTEDLTRHHVTPLALESAVREDGSPAFFDPAAVTPLVPMCRRCNSSIGTKRMAGLLCPMHGGQVAGMTTWDCSCDDVECPECAERFAFHLTMCTNEAHRGCPVWAGGQVAGG